LTNREERVEAPLAIFSDNFYDFPRWFASQAQIGGFFFQTVWTEGVLRRRRASSPAASVMFIAAALC
jgi:hypothetical protein